MADEKSEKNPPYFLKPSFRWVTGTTGAVLMALGVGLLWLPSDHNWAKLAMCALLGLVGANAVYCALKATEPWIAKIGPFP